MLSLSSRQRLAGTRELVELLIAKNLIARRLRHSLADRSVDEVEQYLLSRGLVGADKLNEIFAQFYHIPYIRLVNRPVWPEAVKLLPEEVERRFLAVPYEQNKLELSLAVGEPSRLRRQAPNVLVELAKKKGLKVSLAVAPKADILAVLNKVYGTWQGKALGPSPVTPAQPTPAPKPPIIKEEKMPVMARPSMPTSPSPPVSASAQMPSQPTAPANPSPGPKLSSPTEYRFKQIDLTNVEIPDSILRKIPFQVAQKYQIICFGEVKPKGSFEPPLIKVAVVDANSPAVREMLSYIEQKNKITVDRYVTSRVSFETAMRNYEEAGVVAMKEETTPANPLSNAVVTTTPVKEPTATPVAAPNLTTKVPINEIKPVSSPASSPTALAPSTTASANQTKKLIKEEERIAPPQQGAVISISAAAIAQDKSTGQPEVTEADRNLDSLLSKPILSVADLVEAYKGGAIPEIVASTMFLAIRMNASDIHIEAEQEAVRVRFRIDGVLYDIIQVPLFLHAPLVSRIKILARMKIDEQRVPQDGRFDVIVDQRQVDVRVSTLPTVHGEKVVMRLLDKNAGIMSLEQLGITGRNFDVLVRNIEKPYGIILVTGPTGSGKSTTLYAVLSRISKPEVNIVTLEDPVEYELPGLNQSQVKPQIGFTFAEGLRSVLRQDPNIIMVGEIRDLETAAMSTHAALTGHLVLSTLHTNDATGALPRLINMGVEPFLITSSLNAVVGQRLVRKVCESCREPMQIPHSVLGFVQKQLSALPHGQLKDINLDQLVFYHGKGCGKCTNGYRGRIGIYEVMEMSDQIEELAVRKAPASELKKVAIGAGMITMIQDGLIKALKGMTSIDEIMRVTTADIKEVPEG